jgi:predicted enzyme related to lactoylglutathione lyase
MKMTTIPENQPARFCWVDLAAADARAAVDFYRGLFGWQAKSQRANGGEFLRFSANGEAVASLYQLNRRQIEAGVPPHWTAYVAVADIDDTASRAGTLGGRVVVKPFAVDGMARISLIADPDGALIGLWELAE